MEDDLLGQAQAVLSGSTPKGGLLDEALGVLDKYKPDKEFVDQERRMQEARVWAGQKRGGEKEFGFGLGLRLRTRDLSLPFQGAANAVARGIAGVENPLELQKKAQDAFAKGEATDEQLARLALGEYEQARNQSLGISGKIGQGIGQAAPMVGEALVGGQAVRGLGVAGGAVVNRFAPKVAEKAASLTAKLPSALRSAPVQSAAIQTAATPLTPGLWLEESQQRAVENGGNWYDAKNVAAPMVRAAFQNAIMGHLGEATKGMNVAKRVGLGAALMPAEQAGADAITTLAEKGWKAAGMDEKWATKTEWGTIGQFVRGESGDGWASLATQATMGALFAGFMGQKADPVKKLASAADSLAKDGVPQDLAGRVINEAMNRPPETIKNPEVRAFVEDIIDLKPVEPPKTRSAGPSPEPVQTPVEAKKTAPEKPRTANEALAKLEDPFGEYKPKGPVEPYRPPAASERMVNETDAPATPPEKPKIGAKKVGKKDLVTQKQKAVEEAKAKEEARKESLRRDQAENDAALDNFFAKPIEETKAAQADDAKKIEAKQAEQASGFDDAFADMMGMEKAVPLGGGFVPKSGLVVANIGKGGRIYYGRPGDIHASLSERYPHKDRGDWEQVGFAGPDGKFLTREQALEFAQKEGKVKTSDNMKGQLDAMDYRESAEPAKPVDDIERRETYGEPPDGNERRRYGLRFEGSEPLTEGRNDAEKHAIDKYGKENLYRVKVNDAEGKEVADAIIKEEGDTLIVPWLGKKGSASGEGKGKDLFGTREMTALGKQLAETYPDMNILKYQVGNDRNNAGAHRIVDLNKYRSRLAKKAEKQAQPADPNDNSTRAVVSRALGDRMQDLGAGVYRVTHGDRYLDVTTNGPDRAIINFDHIDPETAEGLTGTADPANLGLSKGTKAIFSDMKAIVEGLRKAGKIIEYDATPVVGAGNRLSRSSLYERLLTKAGYERVQKESFSKSAIWKPKETPVEPKMTKEELFKVKMLDWREQASGEWEEISRHTHLDDAKQAAGKDGATGQVDSGRTAGGADKSVLPYGVAIPEFVAYRKKAAPEQPKQETPDVPARPAPEAKPVRKGLGPKRTGAEGGPAAEEGGVPAPAPSREVGGRVIGADTKVKVPGTKAIDGRYEVRELRDVIASDTPGESGGFRTREDYPEGLQPRKYTGNQTEMEKVRKYAMEMDTAQYLTDDPNATGGPPTITPEGIVLNGNGRQMSLEEAARTGTYAKYKADLAAKAERFGIDPKQIEGMKEPVLYRVVNMDPKSNMAREFARRGNESTTQKQTPVRRAASLGGIVDDAVLSKIKLEGGETFSDAVNDKSKGKAFRERLRQELPSEVIDEFFNKDDTLTPIGKIFVGDMLLTKVVQVETIEALQGERRTLANAVEGSVPQLLLMQRGKINPVPALNEALAVIARNPEVKTKADVEALFEQLTIMDGVKETISPEGRMMLDFLVGDGSKVKPFREAMKTLAGDLKNVGKVDLFGKVGQPMNELQKIATVLGVKPRNNAKFVTKTSEIPSDSVSGQNDQADFGKPLTTEEKNMGQARGGSPAGDELPRLEGGLKEFALANEAVDAERKSLGLPPLMASARKSFGEVWDRAMVILGKDPNASADLVNDLSKKMRNMSDEESALLLHRHIQFNNAYERTIRQASAAAAVAHKTKNYAEFDRIANRADEILNEIKRIGDITKKTGSEAGRTLAFRRQMAAEDYSLGRMMGRLVMEKKAPLTAEETQKVTELHDKIKRLEERLRDFEAKEAAEADVIDLQPAEQPGMIQKVKDWLGGIFKPKPGLGQKPTKAWEFADRMEREAAKELMQKFGPGKLFSGFDPTAIAPLAKYTAAKIIKSGLTFADFSKQIVARFGDAVKPHLDDIWKQAQSHADLGKMDKVDVQVEQKKTRSLYDEMIAAFQRKNQSLGRKGWEGIKETNNIMRLIQTSMDLSGIGRQGGPLALINPTKVPAAIKEMIQSIKSEHGYERNQMQIRNRKNARDYELGELEFTDHNADPTRQEESIAGRFTGKIPGVAASARAFNGFLNRLRADAFDAMSATITSRGQERVTELRDIGNWINAITGRGRTGYRRIDDATAHLAQVFYSPRHAISRFQVLSGQPFWGAGTWKTKKLIAQQYAKYAIGMGAVYGLAKLVLGDEAEIEKDPRSSDLGKIKIGRTRIDPLAGLSQSAVVTSRLLTGESKSPQTGEVKDLRGKGHKFKDPTSLKVAGQFVRNKLTPLAGEVSDFIAPELTPPGEGKGPLTKMTGEQKGKLGWAIRQADKPLPLTFGDMYDAFKEHGYTRAAAISLLATLGWGSQVHDSEHKKK